MSFDFGDSDLSDLTSSSEDEYVPLAQLTKRKTKTKKLQDKSGYTITGALRPPRTAQYTARSLHEQIVEGTINLDPDYQRDVVWKEEKQIGLVDSIFRNYYIPPVIFAVKSSDDGTEERVCIDGKQRLTSIQRFMDGLIPHKDGLSGARYWYKSIGSGKRTLLPASTASQFANKQIVCMEYHDLTGDQEREIFQRVQLGVALTPAERMAAITGPWPTFIREIETQILGEEDGFGDALDWGQSRGRDFQGIAAVVFVIDRHPAFAVPVSPGLDKWLTQTLAVPKKLRSDVLDTFQLYLLLTKDSRYNAPFQTPQRISPVEFIMIGFLIYVHRQTLSLTQLSLAIEAMRADIRGKEKDIRTNKRVAQLMFKFINEEIPTLKFKKASKTEKMAIKALVPRPVAPPAKKATGKRKRPVEASDDEEEVPLAKPKTSTTRTTTASRSRKLPAKAQEVVEPEEPAPKGLAKKYPKIPRLSKSSTVTLPSPTVPAQVNVSSIVPKSNSRAMPPPVDTNLPPSLSRPSPRISQGSSAHAPQSATPAATPTRTPTTPTFASLGQSQSMPNASEPGQFGPQPAARIKAEPDTEVFNLFPVKTDRLAAIRAAKGVSGTPRHSPITPVSQSPSFSHPPAHIPSQTQSMPPLPPAQHIQQPFQSASVPHLPQPNGILNQVPGQPPSLTAEALTSLMTAAGLANGIQIPGQSYQGTNEHDRTDSQGRSRDPREPHSASYQGNSIDGPSTSLPPRPSHSTIQQSASAPAIRIKQDPDSIQDIIPPARHRSISDRDRDRDRRPYPSGPRERRDRLSPAPRSPSSRSRFNDSRRDRSDFSTSNPSSSPTRGRRDYEDRSRGYDADRGRGWGGRRDDPIDLRKDRDRDYGDRRGYRGRGRGDTRRWDEDRGHNDRRRSPDYGRGSYSNRSRERDADATGRSDNGWASMKKERVERTLPA